jgi:3-methyladenine DNA glycosylase AlkD
MSPAPAVDAAALADELEARLREHANPERAEQERRYLKSELHHLGVSVPAIRRVTRHLLREQHPELGHDEVVALVAALWDRPAAAIHERRMAATEVLERSVDLLSADDVPLLERLVRESRTWALVDGLAVSVIGQVVDRDRGELDPVVRRWATDADMWIRRTSLLVHLPGIRRDDGEVERFLALAAPMLEEREFFIRKAIGWVLRELGRRRPQVVVAWLEPRLGRAAGLTVREAVKHLPDPDRERLLAERKAR